MGIDGPVEDLVGILVTDETLYDRYREGMLPILKRMGGYFRYDARVQDALKSPAEHTINRIFVIGFPDAKTRDAFFSNPDYLMVRKEFFENSVSAVCRLARYQVNPEAPGL
ncbi:MAG: DUF1330 domain-containing protein [Leptospiraceae bacterium]|nr:DUF1330 domain-containing protein [Leptospiraceae bacterium]